MFTRPAFYHPYKASPPLSSPLHGRQPAGFRFRDHIKPRPFFNPFQGPNVRSTPPTPFGSPAKGYPDDDAPPTLCLNDLFAADEPKLPERRERRLASPPPKFFQAPRPKAKKDAAVQDPLAYAGTRKGRYGHKQLTMNSDAIRSFVLPYHRRAHRTKEKRDRVRRRLLERHERLGADTREEISGLCREAEAIMKHGHMEEEDHIFLEQLKALQLDHVLTHDLERCRERMTRAEAETNNRTKEHEERDREAAKLWVEKETKRQEDAARRQKELEDEIRRREEERRRAHEEQERKIREEQERLFREEAARKAKQEQDHKLREEKHRKYQEERNRKLREARERLFQEQRERQAHLLAGQVRHDAPVPPPGGDIVQQFTIYEAKWDELRNNNALPPIDVSQLPWPVLGGIRFMEQITYEAVRTFIFHPDRPSVEGKSARDKVKVEVLRFHPDKFNTRVVPKVQPSQQAVAQEIAGAVTRILTSIMTEEMGEEKSV